MKGSAKDSKLFADFEFNRTVERMVNLVSCSTFDPQTNTSKNFWLHNSPREQKRLKDYLLKFQTVVSYAAIAEARSFLALGLNPLDFNWVDLFIEYKMISNHNDQINWGKQLVNGRVKRVFKPRPKWERVEGEEVTGFKPTFSLAEATFKLTGQIRDTKHKNEIRDLIISDPKEFTGPQIKAILEYGEEDVVFLPDIERGIVKEMKRLVSGLDLKEYDRERKARGRYAVHTALMESNGYPIDYEKTRNFASQVGIILYDLQMEINDLFPDIQPFKWDKRQSRFTWNQKRTRDWITSCHDTSTWMKTDTGNLSLSLEAFEKFYQFKHDYPQDNFGAQMVRFLKMKQSLYGFSAANESKSKKSLWDSVGSDKRVRPYMNIFGAQSSRSQPAATGFMFLKPAWMRALVMPPKGSFMAGIDYGSQEFFLAALKSGDKAMIQAYLSGDPYLAFGKLSKQIPKDGTKESHFAQRELCKSTVLGISYLMSKYGLAIKLTNDTKRVWTEEEAQEQIDLFYNTFPWLKADQDQCLVDYQNNGYLKLPCGWYMFGDNPNFRSVTNVPIQGRGASIMRKAVDLAYDKGVTPMSFTLHDALYIEAKIGEEEKIVKLRDAMREAFVFYAPDEFKDVAARIRLDPKAWSRNYKPDSEIKINGWKIPTTDLHIDKRALVDYQRFSPYFEANEGSIL